MMETIIANLMNLNFSRNEALVYYTLLENPGLTVYQIAKELNLSRSSIYPVVEKLLEEGALVLENKEKDAYYAQDPQTLFLQLKEKYNKSLAQAKESLKKVKEKEERNQYLNLISYSAIIAKARTMLLSAKKEVYINTDIPVEVFDIEFSELEKKGVRVLFFSFNQVKYTRKGFESFSHGMKINEPNRLMLVVDYQIVLVANINESRDEWLGTFTNNPLMVRIISEHIHHDIYLLKMKDATGINFFELHPDIFLGTINEKGTNHDGGKE